MIGQGLSARRSLPSVAMSASAYRDQKPPDHNVGRRVRNAYVESFNARRRDACLNTHWFQNLLHARSEIARWHQEYNAERPKKRLGGHPAATYAKQ